MTTIPFTAFRRLRAAAKATPPKVTLAKELLQFLLYAAILFVAFVHREDIGAFIRRVTHTATQVSIAGATFMIPSASPAGPNIAGWSGAYRVHDKLDVRSAHIGKPKDNGELVEVCANAPVNLQGGFIGDAKKMRLLRNGPVLRAGQCATIYTMLPKPAVQNAILALQWDTNWIPPTEGVFKGDPGEGDRIVIIDARKEIVVDLEFWWTGSPPA